MIPMLAIETSRLEPPYDKNGKVTPVTGTRPTTTARFKTACNIIPNDKPKTKYLPKRSSVLKKILIEI